MLINPYVVLFHTINFNYLYDLNKKELVQISEELHQYLEDMIAGNKDLSQNAMIYHEAEELIEKGLLSNNRVKVIEHPLSQIADKVLDRRIQKITLQLTQNCNFRCKYCHYTANDGEQRTHSNKKMSFSLAKRSVDFLKKHSIDSPEVYVGFYGGEPLLEFQMIKDIVKYAEKEFEGKKVSFSISTNGTLLTAEIMRYMEEHNFDVLVSLDGPKELHDRNRVFLNGEGTFEYVIDKLKYMFQYFPQLFSRMQVNVVIDPSTNYWEYESIFSKYQFLKEANFSSSVIDDSTSIEKNIYADDFYAKTYYDDFLTNLVLLNRVDTDDLSPLLKQKDSGMKRILEEIQKKRDEMPEKWVPGGPCMPGELRMMITVEGNFVVCERVNEISECMIIGDIERGIVLPKVKALLNVAQITKEECINCIAFDSCTLCAKFADDHGTLSKETRESNCDKQINLFRYMLEKAALMQEASELYNEISSV